MARVSRAKRVNRRLTIQLSVVVVLVNTESLLSLRSIGVWYLCRVNYYSLLIVLIGDKILINEDKVNTVRHKKSPGQGPGLKIAPPKRGLCVPPKEAKTN